MVSKSLQNPLSCLAGNLKYLARVHRSILHSPMAYQAKPEHPNFLLQATPIFLPFIAFSNFSGILSWYLLPV